MPKANINLQNMYPRYFRIVDVVEDTNEKIFEVYLESNSRTAICPLCRKRTKHVHSTHTKHIQDLPILDHGVELIIECKRYFCSNKACSQGIFMEPYHQFIDYYGRMTRRCRDFAVKVAVVTDAENASKLLQYLHIRISGDTLLRYLRQDSQAIEPYAGKGIGVDDWAYRKRKSYGTLIVDLETHQPIDLLEGRDGEEFKAWLRQHPDIQIVSRDRASAYASAVDKVLPDAIQIADRFHISKNALDALKLSLSSYLPTNIRLPVTKGYTIPDEQGSKKNRKIE